MTQGELWLAKYNLVVSFIETNHRNPSKYDPIERGQFCNWLKHNKRLFNSGQLKEDREERFEELMKLMREYKHKNQYE